MKNIDIGSGLEVIGVAFIVYAIASCNTEQYRISAERDIELKRIEYQIEQKEIQNDN